MYQVEYWLAKINVHLEPVNVTLFGNRVFAHVIKNKSSQMRMVPKFNDCCSYNQREIQKQTHTEGTQAELGVTCLQAKECQRM